MVHHWAVRLEVMMSAAPIGFALTSKTNGHWPSTRSCGRLVYVPEGSSRVRNMAPHQPRSKQFFHPGQVAWALSATAAASIATAQYLNSGILPNGSSESLVSRLAGYFATSGFYCDRSACRYIKALQITLIHRDYR